MQLFKPFDGSTVQRYHKERVLYVQSALFPFGISSEDGEINERWYCMFSTQRFVLCKVNSDGCVVDRKQLSYDHVIQFKLKKNKRFKKSNLPSIKIYVKYNHHQHADDDEEEEDTDKLHTPRNVKLNDEEKYPKVVVSFDSNEHRDTFYAKMCQMISNNKCGSRAVSLSKSDNEDDGKEDSPDAHHADHQQPNQDLYETLDVVIERQNVLSEYIEICQNLSFLGIGRDSNHSNENFRFLEPARKQMEQITDVSNPKHIMKLSSDDTKHIQAYYRAKQDNFQIRNNRKQWFIDSYAASKLFAPYFPVSVNEELQWVWIQQICRASIYFISDEQMNIRCMKLIDILMTKCFESKYIKVMDVHFHQTDYQNLEILLYLMNNYVNLKTNNLDNVPKFNWKQMIPLLIKNRQTNPQYTKYFIELVSIPVLRKQFKETDIWLTLLQYLGCNQAIDADEPLENEPVIQTLCNMFFDDKKVNKIWPENALHLQQIIATETDESLALLKIKVIVNRLDPRALLRTYPDLYDGLNALQFAEKKHVWPKVVQFLQNKVEGFDDDQMNDDNQIPGACDARQPHKYKDTEEMFLSDSESRNHEEGDSMFFSSLFMNMLRDKEKASSPSKSKSNVKPKVKPINMNGTEYNNNNNVKASHMTPTGDCSGARDSICSNGSSVRVEHRISSELTKLDRNSPHSANRNVPKLNNKMNRYSKLHANQAVSGSPWAFSNFVGQCFSFTSLNTAHSPTTPGFDGPQNNNADLQRRLQSYVSTVDKFKAKTRSLEMKIANMNKAMDKQNQKIVELKLENKMIKNVYMDNEFKNNNNNDYDENMVNLKLIKNKQWKEWSYLECIHWICSLHNGRYMKYKNTLLVNMKLRNICGKHFARIDKSDLTYFYGIIEFDDVCDLYQQITNLVAHSYHE